MRMLRHPLIGAVLVLALTLIVGPPEAFAVTSLEVSVTDGAEALPGATVTFINGSGPAPKASSIMVQGATTILATITAGSGGPKKLRVWDVQVTNPDSSFGVLVGGFTVNP